MTQVEYKLHRRISLPIPLTFVLSFRKQRFIALCLAREKVDKERNPETRPRKENRGNRSGNHESFRPGQNKEYQVRRSASEKLGIDLFDYKQFIRQVVDSYLKKLLGAKAELARDCEFSLIFDFIF